MDNLDALHRGLDQMERIVRAISPTQYDRPTPCTDFDIRALLNHTVASLAGLASAATGETWDMTAYERDVLGDDPGSAFAEGVSALRRATVDGGSLERDWAMPFGPTPGEQAIAIGIIEVTQHGWDLAEAAGQDGPFDEELAEAALVLAHANMPPDDDRPAGTFGHSVPVPDDAPARDRLAGFLGRTP